MSTSIAQPPPPSHPASMPMQLSLPLQPRLADERLALDLERHLVPEAGHPPTPSVPNPSTGEPERGTYYGIWSCTKSNSSTPRLRLSMNWHCSLRVSSPAQVLVQRKLALTVKTPQSAPLPCIGRSCSPIRPESASSNEGQGAAEGTHLVPVVRPVRQVDLLLLLVEMLLLEVLAQGLYRLVSLGRRG